MNYRYRLLLLISVASLIKLALGSQAELNNDEAYYLTYAQHLQWNYFDHPPMVAIFIRLFTANLYFHHELFLRLAGVVTSATCTWLIFRIGSKIQDEQTGWIAACLYTSSFYASIIAGLLILPDTPQMLFWLFSVLLTIEIIARDTTKAQLRNKLLLLGMSIALTTLCKVHGLFLWAGFLGFAVFERPALFRNQFLYLGLLVTALLLAPSYYWSYTNHFSTFDYHSARVTFKGVHPDSFLREILGEILYANPINFFLMLQALIRYRRQHSSVVLLKWLSFPLILTVITISIFNDTLPHWSGPAYSTLIPFSALYLRNLHVPGLIPKSIRTSLVLITVVMVIMVGTVKYFPGSLGRPGPLKQGAMTSH